jgi:excisionase family DNA binding protein
MPRTSGNIIVASEGAGRPEDALDALAKLDDYAFIEVQIKRPRKAEALFPVGFLRRYRAAQSVPGRQLLVFDSDEEVSSQVAANMLGVSRPHLNELLEVEAIPHRRVGNQRCIRVLDLHEFVQRRAHREAALGEMANVVNESAHGWSR